MNSDIKQNPTSAKSYGDAPYMTDEERTISFLNRYFIYKKIRKVSDAEKVSLNLQHKYVDNDNYNKEETAEAQQDVRVAQKELELELEKKMSKKTINATKAAPIKKPVTKLKKKVKLNEASA